MKLAFASAKHPSISSEPLFCRHNGAAFLSSSDVENERTSVKCHAVDVYFVYLQPSLYVCMR